MTSGSNASLTACERVGRVPKLISVVVLVALSLTGCSGGSALNGVAVKGSGNSTTVSVPKKFAVDKSETKVLKQGTGAKVSAGDTVKVDYVAVNGRTGKVFDNSFKSGIPYTLSLRKNSSLPGFVKALSGKKVGARVLTAVAPIDGFATDRADLDLLKSDTMVFLFVVRSKVPLKASGKAVALPADVPSIVFKSGKPTGFKKTATTPATLTTASAHVTIQGSGAQVKPGGTVVAQYVGQVFPDGSVFDSSWARGEAATFSLQQVIPCWQNLLPGVRVGSRVVLECPTQDAYGDNPPQGQPSTIKAGDSLLFAVDVLDTY
jgi:FKBP-type peptidyl-prolyl cis-trans isomerase